ncbi:listerin E3 ubiquitin protein ligase 1 [Entophlyctis sp. JEL0112]|nr:listerin E3 ubiquitin protein ligase 1 [Entophlyctis sp. JEL0112]
MNRPKSAKPFSAASLAPAPLVSADDLDSLVASLHPDLKVIVKSFSKKDSITKTKAADSLLTYLSRATDEDLRAFGRLWPMIFNKSALDVERKIRESMIASHSILFSRLKKEMAPTLKSLIGTWLCLMFDNSAPEVAKVASESFMKAFPNKRADVLVFCQSEIFSFVNDNLIYHSVETLSDSRYNTPEEMISKYSRVVAGSFSILSYLYETIPDTALLNDLLDPVFENVKFWEHAKSKHSSVRISMYALLKSLAQIDLSDSPLSKHIKRVKSHFVNECFLDSDASTHGALWDALLSLSQKYQAIWNVEEISLKKSVFPRLFKYLENGCYGSGSGSWPALLALLATLPAVFFAPDCPFQTKFFDSLWWSLSSTNVTPVNSKVLVNSIQECCLYLLLKFGEDTFKSAEESDSFSQLAPLPFLQLHNAFFFPYLNLDFRYKVSSADLSHTISDFYVKVCSASVVPKLYAEKLISAFCSNVVDCYSQQKQGDGTSLSAENYANFCDRLVQLFLAFPFERVKGSLLHKKLTSMAEDVIAVSFSLMLVSNDGLKSVIQVFCNLTDKLAPLLLKSSGNNKIFEPMEVFIRGTLPEILRKEEDSIRLIQPILKWIEVFGASENSATLHEDLLKVVVDSAKPKTITDYVTSNETVTNISRAIFDALNLKEEPSDCLKLEYYINILIGVAKKSIERLFEIPNAPEIVALVVEIRRFEKTGALAESLWECVAQSAYRCDELGAFVLRRWKGNLLDDSYAGSAPDFLKIFDTLNSYYSEPGQIRDSIFLDSFLDPEVWSKLRSTHIRSRPNLGLMDSAYLLEKLGSSVGFVAESVGDSLYARVSSVQAKVAASAPTSQILHKTLYELLLFDRMLLDSENDGATHTIALKETSNIIQQLLLRVLAVDDSGYDWISDSIDLIFGRHPLAVVNFAASAFGSAYIGQSTLDGIVFANIVENWLASVKADEKVIFNLRKLLDGLHNIGCFELLVPLSEKIGKKLNHVATSELLILFLKSAQIQKKSLADSMSVRKAVASLLTVSNLLNKTADKDIPASVETQIKVAVGQFRSWYTMGNALTLNAIPEELSASVAVLMCRVIQLGLQFDVNASGFILEFAKAAVYNAESPVLLLHAINIYQSAKEQNSESWAVLDRHSDAILDGCLNRFVQKSDYMILRSKACAVLQSGLAYVVGSIDLVSLSKHNAFAKLCENFFHRNFDVQIISYQLVARLTHELVETISIKLEMSSADSTDKLNAKCMNESLAKGMLIGFPMLEPHELIEAKTFELRSIISSELRDLDSVGSILDFIFFILGVGYTTKPFDLAGWEFSELEIEAVDVESEQGLSLLCAHLYFRILSNIPSLARAWWSSCKSRQMTQAVEAYTDKWFSPRLASAEMDLVLSRRSTLENVELRAAKTIREVTATYVMEEASADVVVTFPAGFPLKPVEFRTNSGGRTIGVPEPRWTSWMLSATIMAQNTAIIDALGMWQRNITLHFEGVEECGICYCVVGVIDKTLPSKNCRTCKNAFHGAQCVVQNYEQINFLKMRQIPVDVTLAVLAWLPPSFVQQLRLLSRVFARELSSKHFAVQNLERFKGLLLHYDFQRLFFMWPPNYQEAYAEAVAHSCILIDCFAENVHGNIPSAIGRLKRLRCLDVAGNAISGPLPASLFELCTLETLSLGDNRISGGIPEEVANLGRLTRCLLFDNQLSGELPASLWTLKKLVLLHLDDNIFSGVLPPDVGNLSALKELNLANNQFSGPIPAEIAKLQHLKKLHLSGNQFSGNISPELGRLSHLESLHLSDNNLTGTIPADLMNILDLCELEMENNLLEGLLPMGLSNMTQLTTLRLAGNQLEFYEIPDLSQLTHLHTVDVPQVRRALLAAISVVT